MSELEKLLDAYVRGQASFDALIARLERTLDESPAEVTAFRAALASARDAGLSSGDFDTLRTRLGPEESGPEESGASATGGAPPGSGPRDDADATRVIAGGSGARPDAPAAPTIPEEASAPSTDADATRVLPGGSGATASRTQRAEGAVGEQPATESGGSAGGFAAGGSSWGAAAHAPAEAARDHSGSRASTGAGTGTGSTDTGAPAAAPPAGEFVPGYVLKQRFRLVEPLGEGGMGVVWKAVDKLREEARDRNPYVAIKLLSGNFRDHPEAFIALQREASKAMRLAHPNIATVYDFDRDGETIYMTMEVLDGSDLATFIRKLPEGGLPQEEAMRIVEQLAAGLSYAHAAGLVHSDLKPGNAYLTKSRSVKLLDFGIARASHTRSDAEGETTVFDPGALGALTPAYATVEMFEGQPPDPRDDIYALGIIAYQLITGRHPYNKLSAPRAKEQKVEPAPVAKLSRRQNRGLRRALALERERRTPNVDQFIQDLRRPKGRAARYTVATVLVLVLAGALGYRPLMDHLARMERERVIAVIHRGDVDSIRQGLEEARALHEPAQLAAILDDPRTHAAIVGVLARGDEQSLRAGLKLISGIRDPEQRKALLNEPGTRKALADFIARGDEASVRTGLELIAPFDPDWQRAVKEVPEAKAAVIGLYQKRVWNAVDPARDRYDYAAAGRHIDELGKIYPDSAEVFRLRGELAAHRRQQLDKLRKRYDDALARGALVPDPEHDDIGDVLDLVRRIDPKNPLLHDARLPGRFADLTRAAMKDGDYRRAQALLDASTAYAPGDTTLAGLRHEVDAELERQRRERLAASLEQRIEGERSGLHSLVDYERVRDDLVKLAGLRPGSKVLAAIRGGLAATFDDALSATIDARAWDDAEHLLRDFAPLFDIPYLTRARVRLSAAEDTAGHRPAIGEQEAASIGEQIARVRALLANPALTDEWETALRAPYRVLLARLAPDDPKLAPLLAATAAIYVKRAGKARAAEHFAEARSFVERGREFAPRAQSLARARRQIAQAEEAQRKRIEEQQRRARIKSLEQSLLSEASANRPEDALPLLEKLRAELAPGDPFVRTEAPRAIGEAYLRRAREQAARGHFEDAARQARKGLGVAPDLEPLGTALARYRAALARQALTWEISGRIRGEIPGEAGGQGRVPAPRVPASAAAPGVEMQLSAQPATAEGPGSSGTIPEPMSLPALRAPRDRTAIPAPALSADFGQAIAQRLSDRVRRNALGIDALATPLAEFRNLYPGLYPALAGQLAARLAGEIEKPASAASRAGGIPALDASLRSFGALFPDAAPALREKVAGTLRRRVEALPAASAAELRALSDPLAALSTAFPKAADAARAALAHTARRHLDGLDHKTQLQQYNGLLAVAKQVFPGSAEFEKLEPLVPPTNSRLLAGRGSQEIEAGRLSAALETLAQVQKKQPDALNLSAYRKALDARRAQAESDYKNFLRFKQVHQAVRGKPWLDRALAMWSDNDAYRREMEALTEVEKSSKRGLCSARLAGLGRSARAVCYDTLKGGETGPPLVVVPAGGGIAKAFAIGKYEVSVGEYNTYCRSSRACRPLTGTDKDLPVTGISLARAEAYAGWLSKVTGAHYRLPTDAEWTYAARAAGKQPKRNFNCRVTLGTDILKGQSLVSVQSGDQNGWGLANYVGNAREWVRSGNGVVARGGAFEDPLSRCAISTVTPQDGHPDPLTGFRLVRELR